jgi:2-dehydro-3-deoxyphosphooctonate aldolase (KDO 8-P synthase)
LEEGLAILKQIKEELKVPLISDVHCRTEVEKAAEVLDIIQIPAFLSRQTDLLVEAAKTGRVLNIKKGQFLSPWDIQSILEKAYRAGNKKVLVCERGTSFGYRNLVVDFRSIPVIQGFGVPVIFDATHSVQLPGGQGNASGGQREFIESLSKAAVAAGCCGIFLEVHPNPDKAPCDGPNMLPLSQLKELLLKLIKIRQVVK